jgi:hypothetical protein
MQIFYRIIQIVVFFGVVLAISQAPDAPPSGGLAIFLFAAACASIVTAIIYWTREGIVHLVGRPDLAAPRLGPPDPPIPQYVLDRRQARLTSD